jgi:hypothetical protein
MDDRFDVKRKTPAQHNPESKESYPLARTDSGSSALKSKIKMDSRFRGNDVKRKRQRSTTLTAKKVTRWREATAEALLSGARSRWMPAFAGLTSRKSASAAPS